ncbi:hypothetical protein J19TS2_58850 [Cohnella xylanilytica]|nr:hypothetical protein J19TS2_58850 [Cohnella xylanilytica]
MYIKKWGLKNGKVRFSIGLIKYVYLIMVSIITWGMRMKIQPNGRTVVHIRKIDAVICKRFNDAVEFAGKRKEL